MQTKNHCAYAVKPISIIRILERKTTRLKLTIFVFISLIEGKLKTIR
jgi:hypothetical protein